MSLQLDDQLCFPLYAASRAVQQRYRPLLDKLGLTYTQYLVMLVLWERDGVSVSELGDRLYLDSGTLTPLLKRLERAGRVRRERSTSDGRVVRVVLTPDGRALRDQAADVPHALIRCISAPQGVDLRELKRSLEALIAATRQAPA